MMPASMSLADVTNASSLNPLLRAQASARPQGVGGRTLVVTPVGSEAAALAGATGTRASENARPLDPAARPEEARRADQPTAPGQSPQPQRSATPGRTSERPVNGTAFQRNADGDSVTLSSKEGELTEPEQREVEELRSRDAEVRTHEQAHVAAAGPLFRGGPYYDYRTGPDGKQYAVGGRVSIDTSPGATPEETITKAQRIRQAAMAPSEPSSTDRSVAASASRMEAEARQELSQSQLGGPDDASTGAGETVNAAEEASPSAGSAFERSGTDRDSASLTQASGQQAPSGTLRLDIYA